MMRTLLTGLLMGVGACSPRADTSSSEGAQGADSASTMSLDSVRADSNRIIGHDSAFGPKFAVDSTGKLVDLAPRKL